MVVAKSERAYTVLKRAFKERTVDKIYHALVQGHPDPLSGTVDAPIGRHPSADYKWAVIANGKPSVTHYDTLEAHRAASLLEINLETGRTHQIRVHMAALRHPCVGDLTYGADPTLAARLGLTRQWLHAGRLGFEHPGDRGAARVDQRLSGRPGDGAGAAARRVVSDGAPAGSSGSPATRPTCGGLRACATRCSSPSRRCPPTSSSTTWTTTADHFVAYDDGRAVGAGRLVVEPAGFAEADPALGPVGHLGRLAVRPEARGTVSGSGLVAAIEGRARERGLRVVALSAQTHALGFYERLGYAAYGPVFDDAGLPHRWMTKVLG